MATTLDPEPVREPSADTDHNSTESNRSSNPVTGPARQPKKKSLAAKAWRQAMMMTRRVHLYSGIFMFPFVLLYGFSGWFFNHPGYFRDGEATAFQAEDVAAGTLTDLPSASEIAASVVAKLNMESEAADGPTITLSDDKTPRYSSFYTYSVRTDEANHVITINPNDGSGQVKTTPVEEPETSSEEPAENPLGDLRSAEIEANPMDSVREALPQLLTDLGLPPGKATSGRRSPSVIFTVDAGDVPCVVMYSLGSGSVSSVRQDARSELQFKDLLKRMHLSRTYSPQYDTRWIWALVVDAMFVSMVFWGVSGLFMWWQVKRTRVIGGGVLIASIVFSALMYFRMHDNLTERPPRRSSGQSMHQQGTPSAVESIAMRAAVQK